MSLLSSKPIAQVMGKAVEQPKAPVPKTSKIEDKIVPIPDYTIPHIMSRVDSGSLMANRKPIQDINRELYAIRDGAKRRTQSSTAVAAQSLMLLMQNHQQPQQKHQHWNDG